MVTSRIEEHIDKRILEEISKGNNLNEVISFLKSNCDKFMNRDSFIRVSKRYLVKNWNLIEVKKKYTTYYVIHSSKRKNDIEWVLKNKEKFNKNLTDEKLFKLILLKEKLR
jgi:hypothetical protein